MNLGFIFGLAILIEIMSLILRFKFGLTSRHVQKKLGIPVRIHHMYLGVAIMFAGAVSALPLWTSSMTGAITLLDIGLGVFFSDVVHHFIVLPSIHKDLDFP